MLNDAEDVTLFLIREAKLGPDHPTTAISLTKLSHVLMCLGGRERLDEALMVARSLPDDPTLATDTQRKAFEKSLSALLLVVCEANSYLDLATDPALDLAQAYLLEKQFHSLIRWF